MRLRLHGFPSSVLTGTGFFLMGNKRAAGHFMERVMFFIDGFNVYHSLKSKAAYHKFLWLNYRALALRFTRKGDVVSGIYYFSAYATWKPSSVRKHRLLIDALRNAGVKTVMGKFKEKDRFCKICGKSSKAREEKQTDVNIAAYLFKEAIADNYDTAVLMTNDTDLIPAIKIAKSCFPEKKFGVLFPIDRWAEELKQECHFWRKAERKDLSKCQFPNEVVLPSGVVLCRPPSWK